MQIVRNKSLRANTGTSSLHHRNKWEGRKHVWYEQFTGRCCHPTFTESTHHALQWTRAPPPSLEERVELALMVGVTEYEIQIWFKNEWAKYKQKNSQNVQEKLPESSGSFKDISGSTYSHGDLSVLASAKVESMSPSTTIVSSSPNSTTACKLLSMMLRL